ncbi:MAG: hypothetical protein WEC14_00125 [Chloroflexota bacterium]
MNDDRFERDLRAALAARAPEGAGPAFAARLRAVPLAPPKGGQLRVLRLGRGVLGLAATVIGVALILLTATQGDVRVPAPSAAGASPVPVEPAAFVRSPAGFFTDGAVLDAESRLHSVARTYGVEASFVVQAEAEGAQLSTPEGWPGAYDRDGNPDRDIVAVVGLQPEGGIVCCLTVLGDQAMAADREGAWPPMSQPTNLEADLDAATAEFRDVALDRFVRGIEAFAPAVAAAPVGESLTTAWWVVVLLAIVLPVLVLAYTARRRPTWVPADGSGATGRDESVLASSRPATALVDWAPPAVADEGRRARNAADRTLLWLAAALLLAWMMLTTLPLLQPPPAGASLDPATDGQGVAAPAMPVGTLVLVGGALAAVATDAVRGSRRRRLGAGVVVGLVVVIIVPTVIGTRPDLGPIDRPWAVWPSDAIVERGGGWLEFVTLPIGPTDPFTVAFQIHNPGALPITLLGLDGPLDPNASVHAASLVSLGWLPDPAAVRGDLVLSARPETAVVAWPITLAPGDRLILVVMGRGGACAEPGGTGGSLPITSVPLAYRVLGIERTTDVGLPATLFIAARKGCTAPIPGGFVTY